MPTALPRLRRLAPNSLALALLAGLAAGQVRYRGDPAGPRLPFADHVPTVTIPAPDVAALRAEDAAREGPAPLRFGVLIPAALDFPSLAAWDVTPDGSTRVGRLRIHAPGAHSLGLEFERFALPRGGRVFVHDEEYEHVYGAYDHRSRIPTGEFVIEPFPGDTAVLEYSEPVTHSGAPTVLFRGVIYDYADFFALEQGLLSGGGVAGGSGGGGCDVAVNCPVGDPYGQQKRAAVRTVYQGGLCSGVLLNNTAFDGTQYLYTANHCGTGSTVNVRFNYQTANCNGGSAPSGQNVSGAVLLDADTDTDGRLLRITTPIPASYEPYFSGWSRSNVDLSFGMSMHHPGGGPKEISVDSNGGTPGSSTFAWGPTKVWFMNFDIGGGSGGSSGAPLWDENLRVRGTWTGGPGGSCTIKRFGRFRNFWNDDDLGEHLDPLATGAMELDGLDPTVPTSAPVVTAVTPSILPALQGGTVAIEGTDFLGVTSVALGGQVLDPLDYTVVNSFRIEILDPLLEVVGSVPVVVTNAIGPSNPVNVTVTDTDPPLMSAASLSVPGFPWTIEWGGLSEDLYFVNWSLEPTTIDLMGFDVLANPNFGLNGQLSAGGTASYSIPSPGSLGFLTLYFQVLTFDDVAPSFVGASNVAQTLFL